MATMRTTPRLIPVALAVSLGASACNYADSAGSPPPATSYDMNRHSADVLLSTYAADSGEVSHDGLMRGSVEIDESTGCLYVVDINGRVAPVFPRAEVQVGGRRVTYLGVELSPGAQVELPGGYLPAHSAEAVGVLPTCQLDSTFDNVFLVAPERRVVPGN